MTEEQELRLEEARIAQLELEELKRKQATGDALRLRKAEEENTRLRKAMTNAGILPETEVELAKDLFTPEVKGGEYSKYISKNMLLGNYTSQEAKIILIYQSLVDTAVNESLDHDKVNLAGYFEAKKMAFATTATASKGGFLLTNLRTSRGISEVTSQDLTQQGQQGIVDRFKPKAPQ